jgi:class 3 adenylate cyclase
MREGREADAPTLALHEPLAGVSLRAVAFAEPGASQSIGELESAIAAAGGRLVQVLGRLAIAWFESAGDCVRFGVGLVAAGGRAGLSAGDVLLEHDLLHGLPVIEASRLRDVAEPGQVLCTARLARLAGLGREASTDLGKLGLKGIERPVPVVALR